MQLLAELQKQQNSSRFCDILLQTEGEVQEQDEMKFKAEKLKLK